MNPRLRLASLLLVLAAPRGFCQEARDLLARADEVFSISSSYSVSSMSTYRANRLRSTFDVETFAVMRDGEEWSLSIYLSPERMKGTAYLVRGKEIWVRFASTGRVRKLGALAASAAAGDTDFSYADLSFSRLLEDYEVSITRARVSADRTSCAELTLTPRAGRETDYERLVAYVASDDPRYVKIDYYRSGVLAKTLELKDYRRTGGRLYPFLMVMSSPGGGTRTEVLTTTIELSSPRVREEMFEPGYLETLGG